MKYILHAWYHRPYDEIYGTTFKAASPFSLGGVVVVLY